MKMTNEQIAAFDLESKLETHRNLAIQLKSIKKDESDLRDEICNFYKKSGYNTKGTHNIIYGGFLNVKMKLALNYSLDKSLIDEHKYDFTDAENLCIKYVPELIKSNYNALPLLKDGEAYLLDDCIVVKDAKPTLEVSLREE